MNPYENLDKPVIERIRIAMEHAKANPIKGAGGRFDIGFKAGLIAAYEVCIHHLELEEKSARVGIVQKIKANMEAAKAAGEDWWNNS